MRVGLPGMARVCNLGHVQHIIAGAQKLRGGGTVCGMPVEMTAGSWRERAGKRTMRAVGGTSEPECPKLWSVRLHSCSIWPNVGKESDPVRNEKSESIMLP